MNFWPTGRGIFERQSPILDLVRGRGSLEDHFHNKWVPIWDRSLLAWKTPSNHQGQVRVSFKWTNTDFDFLPNKSSAPLLDALYMLSSKIECQYGSIRENCGGKSNPNQRNSRCITPSPREACTICPTSKGWAFPKRLSLKACQWCV